MTGLEMKIRNRQIRTGKYAVKEAAALYGMLVLIFAAYFSVFETTFYIAGTFMLPVFAAGIAVVVCKIKGRTGWILKGVVILGGCVLIVTPWNLMQGISSFLNKYIEKNNEFYNINSPYFSSSTRALDILPALLGVQILLSVLILSAKMIPRREWRKMPVLLISILPVIISATVGKMPSLIIGWLLLGGVIFYLKWLREERISFRETIGALTVLALLFGVSSAIIPHIGKYRVENEAYFTKIYNRIVEMQYGDGKSFIEKQIDKAGKYQGGGIGKGNLANLSEFHPSGEKALDVICTQKPSGTLYLRAYTGVNYTGKTWEEENASEFRKGMSLISGEEGRRTLMNEPYARISEGTTDLEVQKIRIMRAEASRDFAYVPYFVEVTLKEKVYLDAWIKGNFKSEEEYSYYPYEEAGSVRTGTLRSESEIWQEYREFVNTVYTTFPEELTYLEDLSNSLYKGNANRTEDDINDLFQNNLELTYTKNPGALPPGEEFTEYFLKEKREGFCVHFATAATLLYRACGYPSRFVEGYAVPVSAFSRSNGGTYRARVTDEMAHAWSETFDEELGWVVREHTPSYANVTINPSEDESPAENEATQVKEDVTGNEVSSREENQVSENEKDTENNVTENRKWQSDGNNTADGKKNDIGSSIRIVFFWIIMVIGGIIFIILFIVLGRNVRVQKRYAGFRKRKNNRGIANIYQAVYEICLFGGMKTEGISENMAHEIIKAQFKELTEEEWDNLYLCAQRAAFSGEEISKEEQKQMIRLYQKFRREYLKTLSRKQKLWFLFGKGM